MKAPGTPIYLDIETIPGQHPSVREALQAEAEIEKAAIRAPGNYKDADKIAEFILGRQQEIDAGVDARWRKTSFDGALGQICAISVAIGEDAPINLYRDDWETAEPHLLADLFRVIAENYKGNQLRPVFVGHNVIAFDLRFILQRSILNNVKPHSFIPFNARPWDDHVFDTMVEWAGLGNRVSLDKLCRVFGIPTKGAELGGEEIDGSMVWDFVQAGRIKDVATYCGGDVERVREIHRRMTFAYQGAAA